MPTPTGELIEKFLQTNHGHTLVANGSMDTHGVWEVRGEDPNCDYGGHHHQPRLGFFQGKLRDVIAHAVTLPGFWTWGGGGSISKVIPSILVVDGFYAAAMSDPEYKEYIRAKQEIERTRQDLEAQIAALEAKRNALPRV